MDKKALINLVYMLAFSALWSVVFVISLHSVVGIGIGICFGFLTANSFIKNSNNDVLNNEKKNNKRK